MTLSPEIAKSQAEYAARPFAVRWVDSNGSGTFRFNSYDEAFDYAQYRWAGIKQQVRERRYHASNLTWSEFETPEGTMDMKFVLLANDVSSY